VDAHGDVVPADGVARVVATDDGADHVRSDLAVRHHGETLESPRHAHDGARAVLLQLARVRTVRFDRVGGDLNEVAGVDTGRELPRRAEARPGGSWDGAEDGVDPAFES